MFDQQRTLFSLWAFGIESRRETCTISTSCSEKSHSSIVFLIHINLNCDYFSIRLSKSRTQVFPITELSTSPMERVTCINLSCPLDIFFISIQLGLSKVSLQFMLNLRPVILKDILVSPIPIFYGRESDLASVYVHPCNE